MSNNEDLPSCKAATTKEYNDVPASTSACSTVRVATGNSLSLAPEPQNLTCPHCHEQIKTWVKKVPTTSTHIWALLLCCLFLPCACLPYFIDSCQNRNHYCPICKEFLGRYVG